MKPVRASVLGGFDYRQSVGLLLDVLLHESVVLPGQLGIDLLWHAVHLPNPHGSGTKLGRLKPREAYPARSVIVGDQQGHSRSLVGAMASDYCSAETNPTGSLHALYDDYNWHDGIGYEQIGATNWQRA